MFGQLQSSDGWIVLHLPVSSDGFPMINDPLSNLLLWFLDRWFSCLHLPKWYGWLMGSSFFLFHYWSVIHGCNQFDSIGYFFSTSFKWLLSSFSGKKIELISSPVTPIWDSIWLKMLLNLKPVVRYRELVGEFTDWVWHWESGTSKTSSQVHVKWVLSLLLSLLWSFGHDVSAHDGCFHRRALHLTGSGKSFTLKHNSLIYLWHGNRNQHPAFIHFEQNPIDRWLAVANNHLKPQPKSNNSKNKQWLSWHLIEGYERSLTVAYEGDFVPRLLVYFTHSIAEHGSKCKKKVSDWLHRYFIAMPSDDLSYLWLVYSPMINLSQCQLYDSVV